MTSQHRQLGGIKNLKFLIFIFRCAHGATFTPDYSRYFRLMVQKKSVPDCQVKHYYLVISKLRVVACQYFWLKKLSKRKFIEKCYGEFQNDR